MLIDVLIGTFTFFFGLSRENMLIDVVRRIFLLKVCFRGASRENMLIDVVRRICMLKGAFSYRVTRKHAY